MSTATVAGLLLIAVPLAFNATFASLAVLLSRAVDDADATLLSLATTIGVLAAAVQFLGLVGVALLG